ASGAFSHAAFRIRLPVEDGAVTFAVRPEALGIAAAVGAGAAKVHRVTDYGAHAIVDLDVEGGQRLKALVPDAREWKAGQPVDLAPRAFALYRGNAVIYRSG